MRLAAGIEYDGSAFHGWQIQVGPRSVQGILEQALSQVAAHPVQVVCAGRTDAGVHAVGQVVHFDTRARRELHNWVLGGNANLPGDVRIRWVRLVSDDFHARFSAQARRYRYLFLCAQVPSALLRNRVAWSRVQLDPNNMLQAARRLLGEHDFSSFRAAGCQARHPRRRVTAVDVVGDGPVLSFDITANAFLQHMVRNIAGMLLVVGRGERPPGWASEVLAAQDRTLAPPTAPAQGLILTAVSYPTRYGLPDSTPLPTIV